MQNHILNRKAWQSISLLVIIMLITGCASLIVGGGTSSDSSSGSDSRSASERSLDNRIISAINTGYVHDKYIPALDIKVSCYQGVVTLHGHVPTQAHADRAVGIARSIRKVKKVISKLSIGPR